ncbi:hypothetical protein IFM58399_04051 [Aspergillus lentulus]|uniref:UBC core domain-containing protein n=1 Tax=Aspergillus lentulus TaxID=293939 RepID=A0ABQ1ANH3_ASPLE|nr:uncharacterized protein IFM58399_04051 [Aspergillus lentulus]GFF34965.1 hypothetical protein IFM58399_04051 [Aspergillus lentulus]GFF63529.1 hypothetical protein IFM62136_05672 [Aspergillus lentulus]GFF76013.1 hypothetical protein IFM47457_04041 [Aspergillus lentulus]GFF85125.1 hypothetical protein IFM60648_07260 [Aspergillus lentulus]
MSSRTASTEAPSPGNRRLDLNDLCRLKSKPSLLGIVNRTHHDIDSHQPLGDVLIVSYSSVPEKDLLEFLETGAPPKGYVYVNFSEPSQGNSLLHEDDLELIDRALGTGEIVKRDLDDTLSGTVIGASVTCTLEPIAYRKTDPMTGEEGPLQFAEKAIKRGNPPASIEEESTAPLLHNVPLSELQNYEEFTEGDYIIYEQKLGVVREVERDAVVLLQNQKAVSPLDPFALEIPMTVGTDNVVSWPSNQDAMRSYPLPNGEYLWTVESEFVFPGQFTLTSSKNLGRGDWSLEMGSKSQPEGHVLATPAMNIHVEWLCPNVYGAGPPYGGNYSEVIRATMLQGTAMKCDFGKLPTEGFSEKTVRSDTWVEVDPGDRVRFRNPADATKYNYKQIPTDQSFGYDINLFRVLSTRTEVMVQWQDLSVTTEVATSLHKCNGGGDDEVWPGNLVVLSESLETIRTSCCRSEPRRARKVGVVQAVDSRERVASVRWYKDPDIELLHKGNMLKPGSRLGELGDTVTQVSIYELSLFPGLGKALDDLVLLVPEKVHRSVFPPTPRDPPAVTGPSLYSFLFPMNFFEMSMYLESMKLALFKSEAFKNGITIDSSPLPSRYVVHHDEYNGQSPCDFLGRIVSVDIEGNITVRQVGRNSCRDICVPLERILMVIDDDYDVPSLPLPPLDMFGLPGFSPWMSNPFTFDRTYEYEGGERLDDDSNDEEWLTEDDFDADDDSDDEGGSDDGSRHVIGVDESAAPKVAEINITAEMVEDQEQKLEASKADDQSNASTSQSFPSPSTCPPGFSVLESDPPCDHHFISASSRGKSGLRMSRIRKEYEILETSLPPGIYVRSWESRIDLLRVLIIGPQGTPYEYAPFVIDFQFPEDYPNKPPASFFHSWTNGQGRVNPNLYEDGRICLSILGTWPTKNPEESWSPIKSTALQILVSIMGLVLVKNPFYNEAGYDVLAVDDKRRVESSQYTEKAFLTTRNFIKHALQHPVAGLEDVLTWNYLKSGQKDDASSRPHLLRRAIDSAVGMIEHHNNTSTTDKFDEENAAAPFVSRLSLGAVVMLRKHVTDLEKIESTITANNSS